MTSFDCLISLGSNQGNPAAALESALSMLGKAPGIFNLAASAGVPTLPVGGPAEQDPFLNAAARFSTPHSPQEVMECLLEVERKHGRHREVRWGPRVLDLDLLLHGQTVVREDAVTAPHPRMSFRLFVLKPACQIAADMRHPEIGLTLGELLDHLLNSPPCYRIDGGSPQIQQSLIALAQRRLARLRSASSLEEAKAALAENRSLLLGSLLMENGSTSRYPTIVPRCVLRLHPANGSDFFVDDASVPEAFPGPQLHVEWSECETAQEALLQDLVAMIEASGG